jgi:thiamine transport system substrate-binding protein
VHGFLHPRPFRRIMERLMNTKLLAAGLTVIAMPALAETPVLTVLTYDSFTSEWGPGPAIEKAFEAECACDLKFVPAGDGAALLARVRLEGAASEADVVLGLDTSLTAAATATGLFAPTGNRPPRRCRWTSTTPCSCPSTGAGSPLSMTRRSCPTAPKSFAELAASDLKIVIQDPRSSTPGLGLLLWVKAAYGDEAAAMWDALADNIVTVTPGWSEAYGLFLEGEADMVLSYTTSPAYHLIAESDDTKAAALFDEGHYLQIEVAGKLSSSDQPELADQFLVFMATEAFQSVIPTTNWMYPAVTPAAGLPEGFDDFRPAKSLLMTPKEAGAARDTALAEWQAALAR